MGVENSQQLPMVNAPAIQYTTLRMVEGGSLLNKPTFGEKFKAVMLRLGSVFGGLIGGVAKLFPGIGTMIGAGMYGIKDLSDHLYQKQINKRMNNLARDEYGAQGAPPMVTPGFGMFGTPAVAAPAPSPDGLDSYKLDTVLNREMAAKSQINNFGSPS